MFLPSCDTLHLIFFWTYRYPQKELVSYAKYKHINHYVNDGNIDVWGINITIRLQVPFMTL